MDSELGFINGIGFGFLMGITDSRAISDSLGWSQALLGARLFQGKTISGQDFFRANSRFVTYSGLWKAAFVSSWQAAFFSASGFHLGMQLSSGQAAFF